MTVAIHTTRVYCACIVMYSYGPVEIYVFRVYCVRILQCRIGYMYCRGITMYCTCILFEYEIHENTFKIHTIHTNVSHSRQKLTHDTWKYMQNTCIVQIHEEYMQNTDDTCIERKRTQK